MPSFMELALDEARKAQSLGEVPIAWVIVRSGSIIAAAGTRPPTALDTTPPAALPALLAAATHRPCRRAGVARRWRLPRG